jgi:hypothetical protein
MKTLAAALQNTRDSLKIMHVIDMCNITDQCCALLAFQATYACPTDLWLSSSFFSSMVCKSLNVILVDKCN